MALSETEFEVSAWCHRRQTLVKKKRSLFKFWSHVEMWGSYCKAHLSISVQAGVFIERKKKAEQKDQEEGCGCAGSVLACLNIDL